MNDYEMNQSGKQMQQKEIEQITEAAKKVKANQNHNEQVSAGQVPSYSYLVRTESAS